MRPGKAGVREARAHLSGLLRDVQGGREWVITERGRPVARLVPVSADQLPMEDRIRRLEESGLLEPKRRPSRPLPPPLPLAKGLAQVQWLSIPAPGCDRWPRHLLGGLGDMAHIEPPHR